MIAILGTIIGLFLAVVMFFITFLLPIIIVITLFACAIGAVLAI